MQVYLDGLDQGVVTPNASTGPFPAQQVAYSLTGLGSGPHTIQIVNRTAASLNVDAFTVEPDRTTVEDSAPSVVYAGAGWTSATADQGDCGTDVHCTSAAGAAVTITITGSGVSWVAPRLSDTGSVRVFVDGIDEGALPPTKGAATPSARQVNYSVTGLVPGVHSLKIVNGDASRLAVDAFTVLV